MNIIYFGISNILPVILVLTGKPDLTRITKTGPTRFPEWPGLCWAVTGFQSTLLSAEWEGLCPEMAGLARSQLGEGSALFVPFPSRRMDMAGDYNQSGPIVCWPFGLVSW